MIALMISTALAAPLQTGVTGLDDAKAVHLVFGDADATTSACVPTSKGWACASVDVERPVELGLVVGEALLPVGALSETGADLTLVHEGGEVSPEWRAEVPPATGNAAGLLLIEVKSADANQAPMLRLVMGSLTAQIGCADDGSFPDRTPNDGVFYCAEIIPSTVSKLESWVAQLSMRDASGEDVDLGSLSYDGGPGIRFASVTVGKPALTNSDPFELRIMPLVPSVEAMEIPPEEIPPMGGDAENEPAPPEPPPLMPPPDAPPKAPASPDVVPPSSGVPILWTLFIFALGFILGRRVGGRGRSDELDAATPLESPAIDGRGPQPDGDPVVVFATDPAAAARAAVAATTPTRRVLLSGELSLDGLVPSHPVHSLTDPDTAAIRAHVHRLCSDGGVPPILVLIGGDAVIDTSGGSPSPGMDLLERLSGVCWVLWILPEDAELPEHGWDQWGHDEQAGWSVR